MKDATGELSMTAVAVVAIAAISVLFSTLIWPQIKKSIMRSTYCSAAFNCGTPDENGMAECYFCPEDDTDGTGRGDVDYVQCDSPETISCNNQKG